MSASQSKAETLQQQLEIHQRRPASVSLPRTCLPWQQIPYSGTYLQQPVDRMTSAIRKQQRIHLQADAMHQNSSPNRQPPGVNVNNTPLAPSMFTVMYNIQQCRSSVIACYMTNIHDQAAA